MHALTFGIFAAVALSAEPNPPVWPSATVSVFGPETPAAEISAAVQAAWATNGGQSADGGHGQFSNARYAFLFKPGTYDVEVPVGYYTHIIGLGEDPSNVVFTSEKGVYCEESATVFGMGALQTFWRAAENFQTNAAYPWNGDMKGMLWATAQATPLRRVVVQNDLVLYQYVPPYKQSGYASGGFVGNTQINGTTYSGSQQQYMMRNAKLGPHGTRIDSDKGTFPNGVWNMNFVGSLGAPPSHCGSSPSMCSNAVVTVGATPSIAEKPFITIDSDGLYTLNVPQVESDRVGPKFDEPVIRISFDQVHVAVAWVDTVSSINAKLQQGLHVVLSPGVYQLDGSIELVKPGQVLLGIGFPTLVVNTGLPAIVVGDVDGCRVAGVLLEAGDAPTDTLMRWGSPSTAPAGAAADPGVMHDIFARVGGPATPTSPQTTSMLVVNRGHVIGDNLWLWRADHTIHGLVYNGSCPAQVGAVINGDDVTMYGLKVEHALTDLVQWNGERGQTFLFQAEFPYDATAQYGQQGYVAYRVAPDVQQHHGYGVGAYHNFRDHAVVLETAISVPSALVANFKYPVAVYLSGKGTAKHIINDLGAQTSGPGGGTPEWYCGTAITAPLHTNSTVLLATCSIGEEVQCPGTQAMCSGNSCCPDGSTCPSSADEYYCCSSGKEQDCTGGLPTPTPSPKPAPTPSPTPGPPPPSAHCAYNSSVVCPGGAIWCAGEQCCPDGSVCPSADSSFSDCPHHKAYDCTQTAGGAGAALDIYV